LNNKDGELTEEEYREVIKYGRGMLINIIIGVVAAVVIAVYMGMLKKRSGIFDVIIAIKTILWRISYEKS
jgi:hypothetical protein